MTVNSNLDIFSTIIRQLMAKTDWKLSQITANVTFVKFVCFLCTGLIFNLLILNIHKNYK